MNAISAAVLVATVFLSGCAHQFMRGTVAMKVNDQEAHVCLGNKSVKAGERVRFFVNQCSGGGRLSGGECNLISIGEGKVVRTLNDHYSVVRADPGVKLDEGTIVQTL
jgi:hypothetical protein